MHNKTIRSAVKSSGIRQWQIAEALGINEFSFSRMLRHELPQIKQEQILKVIDQIKTNAEGGELHEE